MNDKFGWLHPVKESDRGGTLFQWKTNKNVSVTESIIRFLTNLKLTQNAPHKSDPIQYIVIGYRIFAKGRLFISIPY